jgi:AsmA protein
MKRVLKVIGIVIVILILIVIALPFLINANTFKPKLESELSGALGRQVTVGNLSLSLWSGGVAADNIAIADDPAFSKSPFVQAKSLNVGVELIPLIFSRTLNVTNLTLNQPSINLVKSENGEKWNFSSLGTSNATTAQQTQAPPEKIKAQPQSKEAPKPTPTKPEQTQAPSQPEAPPPSTPNLSVAKLNVKNGQLTVSQVGIEKQHVYDKVDIQVTNFSFTSSFPFIMTADLPGGGNMKLDGNAGPINAQDAALTPVRAKLMVQGMNLGQSGFIDPAMGLSGIADLNATLNSNGRDAKLQGTAKAMQLKVSAKGAPAGEPVNVKFDVVHNLEKQTGQIEQCDIAMGKAVSHLTGTYDLHGKVTTVNLKLNGQGMPVDDLEAMLPAVGVILPPKATLKGGDLNIDMASSGPVDKLVTTGTVRMENSSLAGFDLGSRLSAISKLAGKQTGDVTQIKNFSSNVRVAPEGTAANNINLDIPSIGVLTGAGTVSPSNQLAAKMNASVEGMNIPFGVTGTTSDPKFTPDVRGIATGLLNNVLGGKNNTGQQQQNPLSGLSGLFKKKK